MECPGRQSWAGSGAFPPSRTKAQGTVVLNSLLHLLASEHRFKACPEVPNILWSSCGSPWASQAIAGIMLLGFRVGSNPIKGSWQPVPDTTLLEDLWEASNNVVLNFALVQSPSIAVSSLLSSAKCSQSTPQFLGRSASARCCVLVWLRLRALNPLFSCLAELTAQKTF